MEKRSHLKMKGLLVAILLMFLPWALFAQEDEIIMNNSELGIHDRPLVKFPHGVHEEIIDCSRCHHDYDAFMVNTGGDGEKCIKCHSVEPGESHLPLMKAIHLQCKECHQHRTAIGEKSGPVMCGRCHVR